MRKHFVCLLLTLALCASLLSASVLAAEIESMEEATATEVETDALLPAAEAEEEMETKSEAEPDSELPVADVLPEDDEGVEKAEKIESDLPLDGETVSGTCGASLSWTLSDGVLTISGTGTMENYAYFSSAPWYSYRTSITSLSIGSGVTTIGSNAFYGCSALIGVTIPDGVTSIGDHAFTLCSGLTSVAIPGSVATIDEYAFYHCDKLTDVTIPEGVTTIGNYAFRLCIGLTTIIIPDSVTKVGTFAFDSCSSLTNVTIGSGVASVSGSAFRGCSSLTTIDVISDSENYCCVDGVLFTKDMSKLVCCTRGKSGTYTIPDSVTKIDSYAFYDCTGLTCVTIPDSVTSIGSNVFNGCTSLTSVVFPNSVTTIEAFMLYGCSSLTSLTIPDGVTDIESFAFSYCTGLTSATLPDSVTNIGDGAFSNCTGLTDVYYNGTEDEWNAIDIGDNNTYLIDATIHYRITITYNANGGECADDSATIFSGSTLTLPTATRESYTFLGWATSSTATEADYSAGASYTSNASVTLYAVWEEAYILGDVNEDGEVTIADAVRVARYDAGYVDLTDAQLAAADVNGDGEVTIADAVRIARYDAGYITEL